jgi:branched-chain amino acid transport system ATP-binding protein
VLTVTDVSAGYRGSQVLHALSLRVNHGEIVALVGANGAGKTTTLRTISGILTPASGTIEFLGSRVDGWRTNDLVRDGLVHVPEERALFGPLTVEENLRMGAWTSPVVDFDDVYALFPILAERRQQIADTLSGGQQRMLAIGRALMARPRLLMLDEPSTGLAPKLARAVLRAVRAIRDEGVAVLLVEQNAAPALEIADRAYVLESGSVVLTGTGAELARDERVRIAYLGGGFS